MKTVSVIVPVYNAAGSLGACLGNLVHQKLQDLELILVNDASTDNSLSVLQACARQFPETVRIIDSSVNRGAGGARNLALDAATGEYIGFVDADDLVDTTMYEKLYAEAKRGDYDIVDCGFLDEINDRAILFTGDDCTGKLDDKKRSDLIVAGGYLCTKIIRRRLFEEPLRLREREGVILEDADLLTYLLAVADSIGNIKEILYKYVDHAGSSSKITDQPDKYDHNIREAMRAVYERVCDLPVYEGIRQAVEYEILQMYSYGVNSLMRAKQLRTLPDADERLRSLVHLKNRLVSLKNYKNNPYVRAKIPDADLKLMKQADGMLR